MDLNHNTFFGWLPNYKGADQHRYSNNSFFTRTPFPQIIRNPNLKQVSVELE
jgi:hypothetical protein